MFKSWGNRLLSLDCKCTAFWTNKDNNVQVDFTLKQILAEPPTLFFFSLLLFWEGSLKVMWRCLCTLGHAISCHALTVHYNTEQNLEHWMLIQFPVISATLIIYSVPKNCLSLNLFDWINFYTKQYFFYFSGLMKSTYIMAKAFVLSPWVLNSSVVLNRPLLSL